MNETRRILTEHGIDPLADAAIDNALDNDACFLDLCSYYADDMPYGVAKARTGDPFMWIAEQLEKDLK